MKTILLWVNIFYKDESRIYIMAAKIESRIEDASMIFRSDSSLYGLFKCGKRESHECEWMDRDER